MPAHWETLSMGVGQLWRGDETVCANRVIFLHRAAMLRTVLAV